MLDTGWEGKGLCVCGSEEGTPQAKRGSNGDGTALAAEQQPGGWVWLQRGGKQTVWR